VLEFEGIPFGPVQGQESIVAAFTELPPDDYLGRPKLRRCNDKLCLAAHASPVLGKPANQAPPGGASPFLSSRSGRPAQHNPAGHPAHARPCVLFGRLPCERLNVLFTAVGTDLGTELDYTAANRCDAVTHVRRPSRPDLER
jgi:hypothetical protein